MFKPYCAGEIISCDGTCMRSFHIGLAEDGEFSSEVCNPMGMPLELYRRFEVRILFVSNTHPHDVEIASLLEWLLVSYLTTWQPVDSVHNMQHLRETSPRWLYNISLIVSVYIHVLQLLGPVHEGTFVVMWHTGVIRIHAFSISVCSSLSVYFKEACTNLGFYVKESHDCFECPNCITQRRQCFVCKKEGISGLTAPLDDSFLKR